MQLQPNIIMRCGGVRDEVKNHFAEKCKSCVVSYLVAPFRRYIWSEMLCDVFGVLASLIVYRIAPLLGFPYE